MTGWRRKLGLCATIAVAAFAFVPQFPDTAHPAPRICRQLENELARGGGSQSAKIDAAIVQQQEQIRVARRQARGCNFKLFGGGTNSCEEAKARLGKMERNLASLQRRQTKGGKSGRSRAEIMAALRKNGCRGDAVAERRPPLVEKSRNLIEHIFGGGSRQNNADTGVGKPAASREEKRLSRSVLRESEGAGLGAAGSRFRYSVPPGRYRTLCVRSCDGYFFPAGTSSSPSDFERDQANCQASCPGTEVQLYYHRQGRESETMVSGLTGQPYADLPAAWLYKQTGVATSPSCTCSAQQGGMEIASSSAESDETVGESPEQVDPSMFQPIARPDPALDPETQANLDGGLDEEALRRMAVTPRTGRTTNPAEKRKVRVVGPVFLPDPEVAEGPQVPDQTELR